MMRQHLAASKRRRVVSFAVALSVALMTSTGATATHAMAHHDLRRFWLDAPAFPSGVRLIDRNVRDTLPSPYTGDEEALVNINDQYDTFGHLHFQGGATENALLPYQWTGGRNIFTGVMVFPNPTAAAKAVGFDRMLVAQQYHCRPVSVRATGIPINGASCAFLNAVPMMGEPYSGAYVILSVGRVECIVDGVVISAYRTQLARTINETAQVAAKQVDLVDRVLPTY